MSGKKAKKLECPIFEAIRKPTAPPTKKIGSDKSVEKVYPARRQTKHKKNTDAKNQE